MAASPEFSDEFNINVIPDADHCQHCGRDGKPVAFCSCAEQACPKCFSGEDGRNAYGEKVCIGMD